MDKQLEQKPVAPEVSIQERPNKFVTKDSICKISNLQMQSLNKTVVSISEYQILQNLDTSYKGQLIVKLSFLSKDLSPEKYTKFLTDLEKFIQENYKL